MILSIATAVAIALGAYLAAGVVVAAAFLTKGLARTDPAAADSPWSFRLILAPSVTALWPVVLKLWAAAVREETQE